MSYYVLFLIASLLTDGALPEGEWVEMGEWVNEQGKIELKVCDQELVNERMRMPRGCVAPLAGVLLTRSYFMRLEMDKVERDKVVEGQEELIKQLKQRIADLEIRAKIAVVEPECSCPSTISPYITATIGVGVGVLGCGLIKGGL